MTEVSEPVVDDEATLLVYPVLHRDSPGRRPPVTWTAPGWTLLPDGYERLDSADVVTRLVHPRQPGGEY